MDTPSWSTAPYGRACASCAQAKCKCMVSEAGGSCARCRRLNRDCYPARRTRKVNTIRRSVAAKTAQLERRLDELTSLVQAGRSHGRLGQTATSANTASSDSGFSSSSHPGLPHESPQHLAYSPQKPLTATDAEDEEVLDDFRSNRLPYLPFMYIPSARPAAEIKMEYPFFWRCLVTLHCKDMVRRAALREELKATAARALMVDCQRSMDLLLGIIAYLAWIGFERQPRRMSLGPYVQMLIGLVLDMGLHRPPPQSLDLACGQLVKPSAGAGSCKPPVSLVRTTEERRAVLGCFILCSAVSHTLGRTDSLRWTGHMKECMDMLAEAKETPSDAVLVQMVRAQIIVDNVTKDVGGSEGPGDYRSAPVSLYLKGLQSQLDDLREQMPADPFQKNIFLLYLHHAETTVYETALKSAPTNTNDMDLTRLSHLYACLSAVQNRFSVLLSLPAADFARHPSTIIFPTSHSLLTLLRLSTFECAGWDLMAVRQTADLLSITEQVADKLAHAADAVGFRNPTAGSDDIDCFTMTSRVLLGLRAGWAARLPDIQTGVGAEGRRESLSPSASVAVPSLPLPEIDQGLIDTWFPTHDLAWLADIPPLGAFP
ncbi:hypothetical protein BDW75DRAFT_201681 [Aspergillus navahoensis]